MNRRLSTAIALALTTITGFVLVTYGMTSGLFGGGSHAEAQLDQQVQATETAAAPQPQVVEQIVYRDEYVQVPAPPAAPQSNPVPAAANDGTQLATPGNDATPPPSGPAATPEPAPGPAVEAVDIDGRVSAVADGNFTVTGTRFGTAVITVNSSTHYAGVDHASFSDLAPGMRVEVKVLAAGGSSPTGPNGTWIAVNVNMDGGD